MASKDKKQRKIDPVKQARAEIDRALNPNRVHDTVKDLKLRKALKKKGKPLWKALKDLRIKLKKFGFEA